MSSIVTLLSLSCEDISSSREEFHTHSQSSQEVSQTTVTISGISFHSEENIKHDISLETHTKVPIRLVNSLDRSSGEYYSSSLFWAYIPKDASLNLMNKVNISTNKTTRNESTPRSQGTIYDGYTRSDDQRQNIKEKKNIKKDEISQKINIKNEPLKEDEISAATKVESLEKTQNLESPRSIQNFEVIEKITSQDIILTAQDSDIQKVIRIDTDEELSNAYLAENSFRQKSASDLFNNTGTSQNFIRRSRTESTDYKINSLQNFITRSRSENNIQTTILGHIAETWSPELQRLKNANILKDPDWTFSRNMEWLQDAIQRKDHFRVVSQPRAYDPSKDERPPVLHEEIKVLMEEGYLFYQGWMIPVGSYHKSDTGNFILSSDGEKYMISDFNRINGTCVHISCYGN